MFKEFYKYISTTELSNWLENVPALLSNWSKDKYNANLLKIVEKIPYVHPHLVSLDQNCITAKSPDNEFNVNYLEECLTKLKPWRKGPFDLYGIHIDSEWQSYLKWNRIEKSLGNIKNLTVLDVGCNNGYFLWRLLSKGVKCAIGVDPASLAFCQFMAIWKLLAKMQNIYVLPLYVEQLPGIKYFDIVISLGVLYHQRSPLDHLNHIKKHLKKNGRLILETIVIKGKEDSVLLPKEKYAGMRNVYFIPSIEALKVWLSRCGFKDTKVISEHILTTKEQRSTKWSQPVSLADFLDKSSDKTIEGYQRPRRAIVVTKNIN